MGAQCVCEIDVYMYAWKGIHVYISVFVKQMYTCMLEKASYICLAIHSLQEIHEILKWNTWEMFYLGTIYTNINGLKGK